MEELSTMKPNWTAISVLRRWFVFGIFAASADWSLAPFSLACAAESSPKELRVEDLFGRDVTRRGLVLVDWEGQQANPAIMFYVVPPADLAFPAEAVLTASQSRLYFDRPSETGPNGPRKVVRFDKHMKAAVHVSIFPDRDGRHEDHTLEITLTDGRGHKEHRSVPMHVIDQDREQPDGFSITVDFKQDQTGFFQEEKRRAVVTEAARDWAFFFADMQLRPIPIGAEETLIWGPDGFKSHHRVTNTQVYKGFLLYAYGIKSDLLRSGGEPSPFGEFQTSGDQSLPIRRSGGLEIEVQGNYNTRGWLASRSDDDWWKATNLRDVPNDLYSIAHHEIGHALIFNPNNRRIERGKKIDSKRLRAYLGSDPVLNNSDHLETVVDPASLRGAFGNEYHGNMPAGRWLITKLDLLCAEAIGYELRATTGFLPLAILTDQLPPATLGRNYSARIEAASGVPIYHWDIIKGVLPEGLGLDAFTGQISGVPKSHGTWDFTVRLRDYSDNKAGQQRSFTLEVAGE